MEESSESGKYGISRDATARNAKQKAKLAGAKD